MDQDNKDSVNKDSVNKDSVSKDSVSKDSDNNKAAYKDLASTTQTIYSDCLLRTAKTHAKADQKVHSLQANTAMCITDASLVAYEKIICAQRPLKIPHTNCGGTRQPNCATIHAESNVQSQSLAPQVNHLDPDQAMDQTAISNLVTDQDQAATDRTTTSLVVNKVNPTDQTTTSSVVNKVVSNNQQHKSSSKTKRTAQPALEAPRLRRAAQGRFR